MCFALFVCLFGVGQNSDCDLLGEENEWKWVGEMVSAQGVRSKRTEMGKTNEHSVGARRVEKETRNGINHDGTNDNGVYKGCDKSPVGANRKAQTSHKP